MLYSHNSDYTFPIQQMVYKINKNVAFGSEKYIQYAVSTCNDGFSFTLFTYVIFAMFYISLKAVDTIGNCQRLAFTVDVSQHMHKITNLWKFQLNW